MRHGTPWVAAGLIAACIVPTAATAQDLTVPAKRDTEPVILTGKDLGEWAVPNEQTVRLPLWDLVECPPGADPSELDDPTDDGAQDAAGALLPECPEGRDPHSHYATPQLDTSKVVPAAGKPVERMLGFRWNGTRYVQIPFQVDEVFTRYLNNTASGFAVYSGEDRHTTYAYNGPSDREGFRFTKDGPADDPCRAQPAAPAAADPVRGLDWDDEVAFMASDAGAKAPAGAPLPAGVTSAREVTVADPVDAGRTRYAYVMLAGAGGPAPAFSAANGYVTYGRDPDADVFEFSESSYDSYGAAKPGIHCDEDNQVVRDAKGNPVIAQRRPRDTATVTTPRYRFRYDGRWLMTAINVAKPGGGGYGEDLVDRWKARAFAQDPASETPCCGYEEEDTNWGGSSILLGERVGPVRAIRETWGADSGTNVVRRETFYRDEMRQKTWLRVHPVPPLDGIYAQWDFNAGKVDRFYNSKRPEGVAVDGRNDEAFGNLDDPCNSNWDANDTSRTDQSYRTLYRQIQLCRFPYHLSIDPSDPTFSAANAGLDWGVTAGPNGTIVDRISVDARDLTPGGGLQSLLTVPYYRDDSCFDDGTGDDPGPKLKLRSADEPRTFNGVPRKCWRPEDGDPGGSARFFQGSIGTHGMHVLAIADSDNARSTVPLTEIVADWRMVMLPGRHGRLAGEQYGRGFEKPLVAAVRPLSVPTLLDATVTTPLGTTRLRLP